MPGRIFLDDSLVSVPAGDLLTQLQFILHQLQDQLNANPVIASLTQPDQPLPQGMISGDVVLNVQNGELRIGVFNGVQVLYADFGSFTGTITDSQHGTRSGGNLHALATTLLAGFMSAADKSVVNNAVQRPGDTMQGALAFAFATLQKGVIAALTNSFALGYSTGVYDPQSGAIEFLPGATAIHGAKTDVLALAGAGNRDVQVDASGNLYAAALPPTLWTLADTDTGNYDLGTGTAPGPWIEMTGLFVTLANSIASGDFIEATVGVNIINKTTNRNGSIAVGLGFNHTPPTTWSVLSVPAGFSGKVSLSASFSTVTAGIGAVISVYARIEFGDNVQFGVDLNGTPPPTHSLNIHRSASLLLTQAVAVVNALQLPIYTYATLPIPWVGRRASITDASPPFVFRAVQTGGGTEVMPVYFDGTDWRNG
jgi:hypothetical protein